LTQKVVPPGAQAYLLDLDRIKDKKKPQVLAAASRTDNEKRTKRSYSFTTKAPLNTTNVMRVLLPVSPKSISVTDAEGKEMNDITLEWDDKTNTCLLGFENNPDGVNVLFNL